jgi:predicted nucleic acid-binding protein
MSAEYFIDTNLFIYAFAPDEPVKQQLASRIIRNGLLKHRGVISSQVYQEFLHAALHKPSASVPRHLIHDYADRVLTPLCRVHTSPSLLTRALEIHKETQYRFYDSLIVAAALSSGAPILYSEDLQHDRAIGHLRIVNPFLS